MSKPDESGQVTIAPVRDENTSVIIASLVVLALNVLVYSAIAVHTILCRRKYGKYINDMDLTDLSLPVEFFMMTPGPIYAAGFLLTIVGLILKECAIDRKDVAHSLRMSPTMVSRKPAA